MSNEGKDEITKVSHHLSLLREEYNKLLAKHFQLEHQFRAVQATSGSGCDGSFLKKILEFVSGLHKSSHLSDISVKLCDSSIPAHRFVLNARGDHWLPNEKSWETATELDWSQLDHRIGEALLLWVYRDELELPKNDFGYLMDLLKAAGQYKLKPLLNCCEQQLLPLVTKFNCVKLFVQAEEAEAESLRKYCSSLMNSHWDDLDQDNFAPLSAQSLYRLLEEHTSYPLHAAVRLGREDVIFLDLIKYTQQLPARLNTVDSKGELPLDVALQLRFESLALCLIQYGASVDCADINDQCLLLKAIKRKDAFACLFLLRHGALPTVVESASGYSVLHLLAVWDSDEAEDIAKILLEKGSDPNVVALDGSTPLHSAVRSANRSLIRILLSDIRTDCGREDHLGYVPLWYALQYIKMDEKDSIADLLTTKCPSCVNAVSSVDGQPLLLATALAGMETACSFLVISGADVNALNRHGQSALHVACQMGLADLTRELLDGGANADLQTPPPPYHAQPGLPSVQITPTNTTNPPFRSPTRNPFDDDSEDDSEVTEWPETQSKTTVFNFMERPLGLQSALHFAVTSGFDANVSAFVDHAEKCRRQGVAGPNFALKNSIGESVLCLALRLGHFSIAQMLLSGGANVNSYGPDENLSLLQLFIQRRDQRVALFLIENGAHVNSETIFDQSPLVLSIHQDLPDVLEELCRRGANMEVVPGDESPLWLALAAGKEDLASILVRYGIDTDRWAPGPDGTLQTLLHRALDERNEWSATFLIRSGCDLNSPRRLAADCGASNFEDDRSSPLHMCATWGLENVAKTLLEHGAEINACDVEGKTPLHIAVENHHTGLVTVLLQQSTVDLYAMDRSGRTAFAIALAVKNNKAASAIRAKDASVAEQYDNKGRTLLHDIVLRGDLEGLLFLLSVRVNVNCRTSDATRLTPLQLATQTAKDELILRNLIVAGANLDERGPRQQTVLHMAAEREDGGALAAILIDAGADWTILDDSGNSALHTAARLCHVGVARILLTQSTVDAESRNMRGLNPLHLAAASGREASAALLALFLECMPHYPINDPDIEGNTPLLLAYMKGNVTLCKALVRAGSCLAATNKNGVSIFNYQLATKQLLVRLLEQLNEEPPWAEYDYCMECGTKFGITTRKHHCRHCGRILCGKCSDQVVPILKFNLSKPVRVCLLCSQVLSSCIPTP